MKTLNKYIQESLLDDEDELVEKSDITLIEEFIKKNYICQYKINKHPVNGKYQVSSTKGDIYVKNQHITQLTNGLFEWDTIKEDFYCDYTSLKSLEGAPKKCNSFYCNGCTSLESLKGSPKICDHFICSNCNSLKTLEGAPKKCSVFHCNSCTSLKTLEGAPGECYDFSCCDCNSLKSLKGAPEKITRIFNCCYCSSLKSLKGAPKKANTFSCKDCAKKFTKDDVNTVCNADFIMI